MPNERPSLEAALPSYDRGTAREHIALGDRERKEATDRFPVDQWPTLPLERYALGQDTSDDTFCQWMEYRTQHLGSIRGGSARKLIIYKHKDKPGWYFDPEYKDEQEAWLKVREAFVQAFEKAKAADWNTIDDLTPLSSGAALRLKTLHLYFPTDVLPISSKQHLRHFLRLLDRPEADDRSLDVVRLNRALLDAVRQRSEFQGWSTAEVERFFYEWAERHGEPHRDRGFRRSGRRPVQGRRTPDGSSALYVTEAQSELRSVDRSRPSRVRPRGHIRHPVPVQ